MFAWMAAVGAPVPFGERLVELLEAQGEHASQAWLATRTGLDRSLISRVIRGERPPTAETLQCLAPALGVDVAALVAGTDAESRLDETADHVRRADYEAAVGKLIEYEGLVRELENRLRASGEGVATERESRTHAEREATSAKQELEHIMVKLGELRARNEAQAREVVRYQAALARAVAQFDALKARIDDTKNSSKAASVLAGIAAVTGVATIAHFLGEDETPAPATRKPRRTGQTTAKRRKRR